MKALTTRHLPLRGLPLLLLLLAGPTWAQTDTTPVELSETNYFGMGARAMGMGTAFVGVSDDAAAMFYNPAGLTQIKRLDLTGGLSIDGYDVTTTHVGPSPTASSDHTRLENFSVVFPVVPQRGTAMGFSYRRYADLDQILFKEGMLIEPTTAPSDGLYELESYERRGTIDAWTGAVGFKLTPRVSLGGSVSYLSGSTTESSILGNYRATVVDNDVKLDLGTPSNPDDRVFEEQVYRDASMYGWTGAAGILFEFDHGIRLGGNFEFPASLRWDGYFRYQIEDWEKIVGNLDPSLSPVFFRDDITIPLTLSGGLSWKYYGLLLSGGIRWTDYSQIDFEGQIYAPPQGPSFQSEKAYRSVVAFNVGGEWQTPTMTPLFLRAGFYTKPLPYKLIAADTDFVFQGDPGTSQVLRDYPVSQIVSDQYFITLGAGVMFEKALSFDLAYQRGQWKRATPTGYENSTDFYPTTATIEDVTQNRWFLSATAHFR